MIYLFIANCSRTQSVVNQECSLPWRPHSLPFPFPFSFSSTHLCYLRRLFGGLDLLSGAIEGVYRLIGNGMIEVEVLMVRRWSGVRTPLMTCCSDAATK